MFLSGGRERLATKGSKKGTMKQSETKSPTQQVEPLLALSTLQSPEHGRLPLMNNYNNRHFLKGQAIFLLCSKCLRLMEIILQTTDEPSVKGLRKQNFAVPDLPKHQMEMFLRLGNNLPRNTPQTLLALRKATGSFTSKASAVGGKKFLSVNPSVTHSEFPKHVINISGPFFSP